MRTITLGLLSGALLAATITAIRAETLAFDADHVGQPPAGWICGGAGGASRWTVEPEGAHPTPHKVLKQSGSSPFSWCVRQDSSLADGTVSVRFKLLSGQEDRTGGVLWRWRDGDNYYAARADALENSVALYHAAAGQRRTLKSVAAPVAANVWHILRVDFAGTHIKLTLDGQSYIELDDGPVWSPGSVGVWTKSDSVGLFDNFAFQPAP